MEEKIDVEIKELQATLANIEEARPFEELTVRPFPPLPFHVSLQSTELRRWRCPPPPARSRGDDDEEGKIQCSRYVLSTTCSSLSLRPLSGYEEKYGDLNLM
jgi:hypothetical protein